MILEAAAASLLMYSREVIDYPVGIRLQAISRSLDMNLGELNCVHRAAEFMAGDIYIIPSRNLIEAVNKIVQVIQQQSIEQNA